MNVLTINLLFSTLVFWVAARIYVLPHLGEWGHERVLAPILVLHALRHLGLMFLAPGAVYAGLPSAFARPAAIGDLIAAVLALASLLAMQRRHRASRVLVWIFNLEGSLDLLLAIVLATANDAAPYMGPAYWIPAFWVPALLVTHYITLVVLVKHWRRAERGQRVSR